MHLNKLIIIIIAFTFRPFLADFSIFEGGKKPAKVFPLLFVHF
jgi:hypothetical protein